MELRTRPVGPWQTNAYVLICPTTGQSVLIDPASEPETLLELLGDSDAIGILLTHSHVDHVGALDEMRRRLTVSVMAHSAASTVHVDRGLEHGDIIPVGKHALQVYHTPGHVDDMICYSIVDDPRIIVGDAIFEGGPGHTSSSKAFQTTLKTLQDIVLLWPNDTVCYPGHGAYFRLGDRRADIEAFLGKDHGEFFGDATWDM